MQIFDVPTDHALHSELQYGSPEFPFAYFLDEPFEFKRQCVNWHWHSEFEIAMVTKGKIRYSIGTDRFFLEAGDGLFLNNGAIHRFESDKNCIMETIVFSPELFSKRDSLIFRKYILPVLTSDLPYACFFDKNPEHKPMLKCLKSLYALAGSENNSDELELYICLIRLWQMLYRLISPELRPTASSPHKLAQARLQTMISFISLNYAAPLRLDEIAASAGISKSEALRCFKTCLRTSPVSFLNSYRLNRAKTLLLSTLLPVTEIALQTGFDNAGYFCKVFKKHYNMTPIEFRNHGNELLSPF